MGFLLKSVFGNRAEGEKKGFSLLGRVSHLRLHYIRLELFGQLFFTKPLYY